MNRPAGANPAAYAARVAATLLEGFRAALEVAPECIAAMQGLALLTLRTKVPDARLGGWLVRIALEGEDDAWRGWARQQALAGLGDVEPAKSP